MPDPTPDYPYVTRMDIAFGPLQRIDVPAIVAACPHKWFNQTLCRVNESVVRLGVVHGEYHRHKHNDLDEFFYCVSGRFIIHLDDAVIDLGPGQAVVIPKGVYHHPRAPVPTVILMVEGQAIVPTGD